MHHPLTRDLAFSTFQCIQAGLAWLVWQRGGNTEAALAIVTQYQNARDKDIFDVTIADTVAMISHGIATLSARGLNVADALALLEKAEKTDDDELAGEVWSFFDEPDEPAPDEAAQLENAQAGGASESGSATVDDSLQGGATGENDAKPPGDSVQPGDAQP